MIKSILYVEDNPDDVYFLQRVFAKAGVAAPIHVVTDGQMAIDYLAGVGPYSDREKSPFPCLVLLDLQMPKKDGFEVLTWIRHQPVLKKLVVVLYSSSSLPSDIDRAYELGVNSYIEKPSTPDRMLEIAQLFKGWWLACNHFPPIDLARGHPAPA